MIHELGSEVEALKPVKKLSEVDEAAVAANPVFGFKRDLVRLVGNMCWRHRKNQDTVSYQVTQYSLNGGRMNGFFFISISLN